ncbi:MAG: hypothetical protein WBV82_01585 [Myxococcaceae bacterium]
MHIQLWNAYASNNSGAYTIVGTFTSAETAAEIASTLAPVLEAQTKWADSDDGAEAPDAPSPLRKFAAAEGLPLEEGWIDWPAYGDDNCPRVVAVGRQVLLHHSYTVSLPRFFGQWFYARGGRVERELDHTHHRLAVVFDVRWPHGSNEPGTVEERARIVVDRLTEPGGPLERFARPEVAPAWTSSSDWMEPALRLGACFDDLVEGVAAVQKVLQRFGAEAHIQIFEAWSDKEDPLGFLRTQRGMDGSGHDV